MKTILTILLTTFSLITFAQTENSDLNKFVVLNKDSLEYVPWIVEDLKSAVLTSNEIDLVDSLFQDYKTKSNNGDTAVQAMGEIGLMDYKRQYLPVLNDDDEKIVWINCFCVNGSNLPHFSSNNPNKWNEEVIIVKDGGNCYLSVFLNLTTKKFDQLMVNGM
jgi:hypothetical protein